MAKILLVSNGHGEDLSGSLIGKCLRKYGHEVCSLPLVGNGYSYSDEGIEIIGNTQEFSTGGLGYTSLKGRLTEFFQGQLLYLLRRLFKLILVGKNYDLLVAIGDIIPICATWLTGNAVVSYLVAYSSHYEGKLRLPWPCKQCLSSEQFLGIYSRDQLTADDLRFQLSRAVDFLGNPFMDSVFNQEFSFNKENVCLGLLPGSRRPELDNNLLQLIRVIELLPNKTLSNRTLSFNMALVNALDNKNLETLVATQGWQLMSNINNDISYQLTKGNCKINIFRNSFAKVLQSSDLLLSMAGTASEQAIGLAKPVIQMPGFGPQFTASFAEAQRRLLGPTVFCAEGRPGNKKLFINTSRLILKVMDLSEMDVDFQNECKFQALSRLGEAGGAKRIAQAITHLIE